MKFSVTNVLAASLALTATSVDAFSINSRQSNTFGRTSLRMVADDAKVVLVTGSSRGLGKAVALEMGKHKQKVVINYVSDGSKASAEEVVKEIQELGGDAIAVQADSK